MKKVFTILFVLVSGTCFSQTLSKPDFIEDLVFLRKTLPAKHINLFSSISESDFQSEVDSVISEASTLNYEIFTTELFKLMVRVEDEHTFAAPKFSEIFPVQFDMFTEGIFVTSINQENSAALSARLVSIDNYSTAEIIERFKQIIPSENPNFFTTRFLHYISYPTVLKGLGIIDSLDKACFIFSDHNNQLIEVRIKALPEGDIRNVKLASADNKLLSGMKKENYWFDYDSGQKILYFNYNKCMEAKEHPFRAFNTELFNFINSNRPEKIILDLRYNSGGNSAILHPFIEEIKKSYLNEKGKLFVLIGKKSFSSAVMNAVDLKRNSSAIFIGEATGGNINHYGEIKKFSLPRTKIEIAYSTRYWENWKGKKGPLVPDIGVSYSIENYNEGKDEALMQVLKNKFPTWYIKQVSP